MPEIITGFSLLLLYINLYEFIGWPSERGSITIIISHVTVCIAFVTIVVQARLRQFDIRLEEAAQDLGATPLKVLLTITLPIIFPAIVSAWLLAFVLSFDDLVIASFTSGTGYTTLPMLIYSKVRLGVSPDINALASIMLITIGVIASFSIWLELRGSENAKTV